MKNKFGGQAFVNGNLMAASQTFKDYFYFSFKDSGLKLQNKQKTKQVKDKINET